MQLLRRIGLYLVGVALGTLAVSFFWKNKKVSFDYGMDARTLKTIRIRKRIFTDNAKQIMLQNNIDTTQISKILKYGDVDFGKSKPRLKPCAEYYVTSDNIDLYVIRCDSTATIDKVIVRKEK